MNNPGAKTVLTFSQKEFEEYKFGSKVIPPIFLIAIWFLVIAAINLGLLLLLPAAALGMAYYRWRVTSIKTIAERNRDFLNQMTDALEPEIGYKLNDFSVLNLCQSKVLNSETHVFSIVPSTSPDKLDLLVARK